MCIFTEKSIIEESSTGRNSPDKGEDCNMNMKTWESNQRRFCISQVCIIDKKYDPIF